MPAGGRKKGNSGYEREPSMLHVVKKVMDYLNIDYFAAWEVIPFDLFDLALKESFIDECMQTEEGQQYLKDCKRFKTKELDVSTFRKMKNNLTKEGSGKQ